jgi:hypothetical protein
MNSIRSDYYYGNQDDEISGQPSQQSYHYEQNRLYIPPQHTHPLVQVHQPSLPVSYDQYNQIQPGQNGASSSNYSQPQQQPQPQQPQQQPQLQYQPQYPPHEQLSSDQQYGRNDNISTYYPDTYNNYPNQQQYRDQYERSMPPNNPKINYKKKQIEITPHRRDRNNEADSSSSTRKKEKPFLKQSGSKSREKSHNLPPSSITQRHKKFWYDDSSAGSDYSESSEKNETEARRFERYNNNAGKPVIKNRKKQGENGHYQPNEKYPPHYPKNNRQKRHNQEYMNENSKNQYSSKSRKRQKTFKNNTNRDYIHDEYTDGENDQVINHKYHTRQPILPIKTPDTGANFVKLDPFNSSLDDYLYYTNAKRVLGNFQDAIDSARVPKKSLRKVSSSSSSSSSDDFTEQNQRVNGSRTTQYQNKYIKEIHPVDKHEFNGNQHLDENQGGYFGGNFNKNTMDDKVGQNFQHQRDENQSLGQNGINSSYKSNKYSQNRSDGYQQDDLRHDFHNQTAPPHHPNRHNRGDEQHQDSHPYHSQKEPAPQQYHSPETTPPRSKPSSSQKKKNKRPSLDIPPHTAPKEEAYHPNHDVSPQTNPQTLKNPKSSQNLNSTLFSTASDPDKFNSTQAPSYSSHSSHPSSRPSQSTGSNHPSNSFTRSSNQSLNDNDLPNLTNDRFTQFNHSQPFSAPNIQILSSPQTIKIGGRLYNASFRSHQTDMNMSPIPKQKQTNQLSDYESNEHSPNDHEGSVTVQRNKLNGDEGKESKGERHVHATSTDNNDQPNPSSSILNEQCRQYMMELESINANLNNHIDNLQKQLKTQTVIFQEKSRLLSDELYQKESFIFNLEQNQAQLVDQLAKSQTVMALSRREITNPDNESKNDVNMTSTSPINAPSDNNSGNNTNIRLLKHYEGILREVVDIILYYQKHQKKCFEYIDQLESLMDTIIERFGKYSRIFIDTMTQLQGYITEYCSLSDLGHENEKIFDKFSKLPQFFKNGSTNDPFYQNIREQTRQLQFYVKVAECLMYYAHGVPNPPTQGDNMLSLPPFDPLQSLRRNNFHLTQEKELGITSTPTVLELHKNDNNYGKIDGDNRGVIQEDTQVRINLTLPALVLSLDNNYTGFANKVNDILQNIKEIQGKESQGEATNNESS